MKLIPFFLILVFASMPAFSAKLRVAKNISDPRLERYSKYFHKKVVRAEFPDENYGYLEFVKVLSHADEETWDRTLKQTIYWLRVKQGGQRSRPEGVEVVNHSKTEKNIALTLVEALEYLDRFQRKDLIVQALAGRLSAAVKRKKYMRIYLVSDENSFGHCSSLAVTDQKNMEILLSGTCYSE